jgi:hypothetical protein
MSQFPVMAGLVPAIHVLIARSVKDVDARDKPGHDELTKDRHSPRSGFSVIPA